MYNYRSLPSILNFYNEQFYGMELIPQLSPTHSREAKLLNVLCNGSVLPANKSNHGIYFRNVCGVQKRIHGASPCNLIEAEEVLKSRFYFLRSLKGSCLIKLFFFSISTSPSVIETFFTQLILFSFRF